MRGAGARQGALFTTAKELAFIALMTALLIACQLALSAVQGVEVVTVLFLSFCYSFGVRRGLVVANCFSLLRCLLFGFSPPSSSYISSTIICSRSCSGLRAGRSKGYRRLCGSSS